MIFLADIMTDGPSRIIVPKKEPKKDKKNLSKKEHDKKVLRQKEPSKFVKLSNRTAGMAKFTQGEIAVAKSMIRGYKESPLYQSRGKQKSIGPKNNINIRKK